MNDKTCFVISPIGKPESDIRRRADQVLEHIIQPAAERCGYETLRADAISDPGIISSQIVQHLINDSLVIADLTDHNPNVFYELAARHAVRRPVIQIIHRACQIPFDVFANRTVIYELDLDGAASARDQIREQIKAVEREGTECDNPISAAIDIRVLRMSDDPLQRGTADVLAILNQVLDELSSLRLPTLGTGTRSALESYRLLEDSVRRLNKTSTEAQRYPIAELRDLVDRALPLIGESLISDAAAVSFLAERLQLPAADVISRVTEMSHRKRMPLD